MLNKNKLKAKFTECGLTQEKVAKTVGISVVTLRKRLDDGNFTRKQMLTLKTLLDLTLPEFGEIFFGQEIAET